MAKALSILFVASEAYPYAKESGVGDVAASLPLAIREFGHDMRMMIPKYGCISERKNKIHDINRLKNIPITVGNSEEYLTTKSSSICNSKTKVQVYVATNHKYFESRKGVYNDPVKWQEYPDNLERFVFYCRSVIETCAILGWYPDIIHCNDWQTALLPAYIRYYYPNKFKKTKAMLTIHNISNQGEFPLDCFELLGLPEEVKGIFTHKKHINLLKGGILYANHVTTVSESYLKQILKEKELTNGLNTILKQHTDRITGIGNGIDTSIWNPKTDDYIPKQFEGDFVDYKTNNKIALCDACGLKYSKRTPVLGMVTRISEQKGVDLIINAIPKLMKLNAQLVILGQGDAAMKEKLMKLQQKYNKKMNLRFAFDDSIAHLVEAGSDMFLMPSRQEGCGLNLFYSLSYGAVPIVHLTGGIKDSAIPYNDGGNSMKANCFALETFSEDGLVNAVSSAIKLFEDKNIWHGIVKNGMDGNYSWGKSAVKYNDIYKKINKDD